MCAVVVRCRVEIDFRDRTPTLHQVHDDWPAELKAQAAEKAAKLVAFLAEHITRRNRSTQAAAYRPRAVGGDAVRNELLRGDVDDLVLGLDEVAAGWGAGDGRNPARAGHGRSTPGSPGLPWKPPAPARCAG